MAFNKAPTAMWSGYSSDGTNITIPIAALPGLTSDEANASTGDWRNIVLALVSKAYDYYASLPAADRPAAFVPAPPTTYPVSSGDLEGTFRTVYQLTFYCDYATPNVADEPS